MNRYIAPILLALAATVAAPAIAAPLSTAGDVAKFYQQQLLNGN